MGRLASKKRLKACDPFSQRPGNKYETGFGMHGAYNMGGKKGYNADVEEWTRSKHKTGNEYISSKDVIRRNKKMKQLKAARMEQRRKNKRKKENKKLKKQESEANRENDAEDSTVVSNGTSVDSLVTMNPSSVYNRSTASESHKNDKNSGKRRKNESMKAYARRLRMETNQILIHSVKKEQKGYLKRKAYFQKKKEKKKSRKRNSRNDSDADTDSNGEGGNAGDNDTEVENGAWTDFTRMVKMPKAEKIAFGDVNLRPPSLSMVPKARFRAEAQGKKNTETKKQKLDKEKARNKNIALMKAQAAYKMLKYRRQQATESK